MLLLRGGLLTGDLRDQALAPLAAASIQDVTATGGCHARAKAVRAFTFGLARLECSFHKAHVFMLIDGWCQESFTPSLAGGDLFCYLCLPAFLGEYV